MKNKLPISALVPTRNRSEPFRRMLDSLAQQSAQPLEMIVVDGSDNDSTKQLCESSIPGLITKIHYYRAIKLGAAIQRNQAMNYATQSTIWLLDDDILFEPECVARLWNSLQTDPHIGGVNAMITNQKYLPPGRISRLLFQFLHGHYESSYAGKCIGPAMNLLPEDREDLPEVVSVEWLNTTCVLYRRQALPHPLFPEIFTGYSMLEDVTLSLTVGKNWKLANARTSRIFHDSQPGDHKNDPGVLAEMDLVNRHYVMTKILGRQQWQYYIKLAVLQLFGIVASLTKLQGWFDLPKVLTGKIRAIAQIIST
ncbi:glycosyltransferase [Sphaerospermopsis aphanizomenoides BCCUSP55]|uniref:glycosyltransferase n=1 Tax=Sphaerospermopsis aphanizomenoides TaxID=459663 RepID=UPI001906EA8B|nr:glycosyltransferase [Sphaerospermopsis aphanizomenoides]MBK1987111.1 glycosyltransferase [Sphaerospermopsis aphanizomenoides BCCUSP55]